ncbi:TolC family protein [Aneurinibacillus uraniidurans]|uniref:TolC family protein n=1 Tax=Aneurinibacillus uraniidurans TaxID=2966586 RepID=UPI002349262E|nr:TolC family protein [Aneurinibacillus sp. B1]WCN38106.1 TolC family protein [Aneurinibacillus sp. B1]
MKKIPAFVLSSAFLLALTAPVYADQSQINKDQISSVQQQQTLTYEQAVDKAFKASNVLKNSEMDIDRSYEIREKVGDSVKYTPTGPGNGAGDAYGIGALKGLAQADMAWDLNKKNYELTKDHIAYTVKQAYNNVLQGQKQLELAKASLDNQALQTTIIRTKVEYGTASSFDLTQEENKLQAAEERVKLATKALQDSYEKFNNLLNLPKDTRLVLTDEPKFTTFAQTEEQMEQHVRDIITSSTAVWAAEQQVKLKQLDIDLYTYNVQGSTPYKAAEIDVQKASNNAEDTKKNLANGIRSIYLNIKQLENRYQELNVDLANAQKTQQMAQIRYNLGIGIKADVLNADLAVKSKQKDITDVLSQLDVLKVAYDKPWVATGASTSS